MMSTHIQGRLYAHGLSEEDAEMINSRCSSVREYQPGVFNSHCLHVQVICDILALMQANDIKTVIDAIPQSDEVYHVCVDNLQAAALLFNQLINFRSLTLSEYLFLCQAVSAMADKGAKVILAFFKHAYQGQWHLACYRYQYQGKDHLPCLPRKEEYINDESDLIREGNEIVGVRATLFTDDGKRKLYEGFWKDHKYHGTGTLYYESIEYQDQFENKPNYLQQRVKSAVSYFKGTFVNGQPHGWGEEYDTHNYKLFEGHFVNGKKDGICTIYYNDGVPQYKGRIIKADNEEGYIKEGTDCEEYDKYGYLLYRGIYQNNKRHAEGEKYLSPHYVQDVWDYGEHNRSTDCSRLRYQYIPDCNLESVTAGKVVNFTYDKTAVKELRDDRTGIFTPLLEKKAYFCRR